jgi:plastocyanin
MKGTTPMYRAIPSTSSGIAARSRLALPGLLFALLLLLAACGSDTTVGSAPTDTPASTPAATATPVPNGPKVTIPGLKFDPASLTVKVGSTVTWNNSSGIAHTVTSDAGSALTFDGGVDAGQSFSFTFTKPGTYKYHCSIHATMHGTIVVTS